MIRAGIVRTAKEFGFGLVNAALERGILPGHTDYTRFIILGTPRTGSTYLLTALQGHSRIRAYGELFQVWSDEDLPRWPPSFGPSSQRRMCGIQQNPVVYLDAHLFRTYPRRVSAVGFKVFYRHAQSPRWSPIWTYLEGEQDIRVLHIKRRNLLRRYLSFESARKTGRYRADSAGQSQEPLSVVLDYDDLCRAFARMQAEEREFDARFVHHRLTDVIYEHLTAEPEAELRRIQAFLNVEYEAVRPSTRRQSTRPMSAAIANYDELRERFSGTAWAEFLNE